MPDNPANTTLHITNGDCAGDCLIKSGLPGTVLAWRDILYEGPRNPGWPSDKTLEDRAQFLQQATGGGLSQQTILDDLNRQYHRLRTATEYQQVLLWFDACLFDQSMLAHLLTCLQHLEVPQVELLCIDAFPGITPFDGLGQLTPEQLVSHYPQCQPLTPKQYQFAQVVDRAFALQDQTALLELSALDHPPIPWVPAAVSRWLQEQPSPDTGLGRLQQLALDAINHGHQQPGDIFRAVATADSHPQYWGDTTLWAKINSLADHQPPMITIAGPGPRLPLWHSDLDLKQFKISPRPQPAA
ncbi:MAG: DUF1835 domain-containing protein [Halopseudomonas sp.]